MVEENNNSISNESDSEKKIAEIVKNTITHHGPGIHDFESNVEYYEKNGDDAGVHTRKNLEEARRRLRNHYEEEFSHQWKENTVAGVKSQPKKFTFPTEASVKKGIKKGVAHMGKVANAIHGTTKRMSAKEFFGMLLGVVILTAWMFHEGTPSPLAVPSPGGCMLNWEDRPMPITLQQMLEGFHICGEYHGLNTRANIIQVLP